MENDIEISQTVGTIGTKTINIGTGGGGDVEAGIELIYSMREHLVDVTVATVYGLVVSAIVLWLKKRFSS